MFLSADFNLAHYPLWTALITPFNSNGEIDFETLEKLLHEQENASNGVLILGSTGEGLALNKSEKEKVVTYCCQKKLKVPLMVGIGGFNLPETIEWVDFLENQNVHCYLLVTPLYSKPQAHGQYHWFKSLMDRSQRPCMLYNIPGRSGCALNLEAVEKLSSHPRFWAIKEASGKVSDFKAYQEKVSNTPISVFSGDDGMLPDYYPYRASGLVSIASNIWPKATHQWVKKVLSNKADLLEVHLWRECCQSLVSKSNPIPCKVLMHHLGRLQSPYLRPPLSYEEIESTQELVMAHQRIGAWLEGQV